jgi:hypothetical protein
VSAGTGPPVTWRWSQTPRVAVAGGVADWFRQARSVLNHIADLSLFPPGGPMLNRGGT